MFSFFKFSAPAKHQFAYRPRFYDPKKEEMEERLAIAQNPDDPQLAAMRLKRNLKRERSRKERQKASTKAKRQSNLRLLIILGLLIGISYYLMTYKMDGFIRFFLPETEAVQELPQWEHK